MNKSLVYGTLLGDAWLYQDKRGNILFAFQQVNKEYAKWKADLLGFPYREYHVKRFDKRTEKHYENLTIHLNPGVRIKRDLRALFYQPKKVVTQAILNELTPEGICLWYLDDGSMYYNSNNCHLNLAVNGFSPAEQELIINYFKVIFNLNFKKTGKAIRLTARKEIEKFMLIIESFIPRCMSYKILSNAIQNYKNKKRK